jgi:hypothetical protein
VKPGADFPPHLSWDWVSHASYGGYKCGHFTAAAGVSGAKLMMLELEKLKLILDSASAFGKTNLSAKQLYGLEVEE